jgi:hypothetical protein
MTTAIEAYDHVNYFVRKSIENNKTLLLVDFWKGPGHRVFCALRLDPFHIGIEARKITEIY